MTESVNKAQDKPYFDSIDPKADFPKLEDELIKFWKENRIFEKSISQRPASKTWTFLDGPPFITGLPHYGTLLSSIPKDLFPRYWTMKGYRVRRVWGWDCHGLPAENKVEVKLGLKSKRDIEEKIGVKKFIDECKNYVSEVSGEWEWYVDHIGRWVDFKNAYKTMDKDYMESVMWVFKQMYDKGYIYKGRRISLYCPHDSTPISNFEVAMDPDNYKEIVEPSNTYKYELKTKESNEKTFILAWSTTPWTKITTTALAVNPKLKYVEVTYEGENYILAESTLKRVFDSKVGKSDKRYKVIRKLKGLDLIGLEYVPHYDFFEKEGGKKSFVVIGGDFVTAEEGTGVVTIAPYGEDDLKAMEKDNIQIVLHVDEEGKFTHNVPNWGGMYYEKTNPFINKDLEERGLLFDEKTITHSVATCWRCHTRLIYAPQDAWYVDIQKLKPKLYKNNEDVNWYPKHFKHGRFLKSVEAAPDWCISRSRYWGSPVPVWECEKCSERFVPGSIKELEEASGSEIKDLHKPEIDEVVVTCKKCGQKAKRVSEVLDSWIEAGSASFAERHFPFDKSHELKEFFPPDFIVEYTGQIRAWFYVLHVISSALLDTNSFKNVLVTGVILGTDGRKMSKNFGNYPDPKMMLEKYGGDALRLYLMSTPVMRAEDTAISEVQYRDQVRNYLLTLWNVYNYFVTYANLEKWEPKNSEETALKSDHVLDKWILVKLKQVHKESEDAIERYDTVTYVENIKLFVTDLSTWYLRRSRDRNDKDNFFATMHYVLVNFSKITAPITPFIADLIYKNLTKEDSVHLTDWTNIDKLINDDKELRDEMTVARRIVELVHSQRKEKQIPVRMPLSTLYIYNNKFRPEIRDLIMDEVNVKSVQYLKGVRVEVKLDTVITPKLEEEAKTRELQRKIQDARKNLGVSLSDKVKVTTEWFPSDKGLLEKLMAKTLSVSVEKGEFGVKAL